MNIEIPMIGCGTTNTRYYRRWLYTNLAEVQEYTHRCTTAVQKHPTAAQAISAIAWRVPRPDFFKLSITLLLGSRRAAL